MTLNYFICQVCPYTKDSILYWS